MMQIVRIILSSFLSIVPLFTIIANDAKASDPPRQSMRVINSAGELDYPPFSIVDEDGNADGFSIDLLKAVAKAVRLKVNFKVGAWDQIKSDLINRRLDALPLVSYSQEREELIDFTAPYLRMHGSIFVRKGEKSIHNEADLKNKEVLVMRGDTAHEYLVRNQLSNKLILTDSYAEAMQLLSDGKYDAVVVQYLVGLELIKKLGLPNIISVESIDESSLRPSVHPLSGFEQKFCIAVKEGDKELQALLNEGLSLVIADGQYNQLYDKWFGPILPKPTVDLATILKYVLVILLPILLIAGSIGIWYLKKEIVRKTQKLNEQILIGEKAKQALIDSEMRLRTLIDTLPDLIWLKDPQGIYLSCNIRFESFFGAKGEEIIGKSDYDFLDKEEADFFRKNDQIAIDNGKPVKNEEEIVFANDGHHEILETIKTPIFRSDGTLVGVLGIGRDITDRVKAERKLSESHDLLDNLASQVPGVIYQYRLFPDGRSVFPYSSPGMFNIYEVTPEEVRVDATPVFGRLHPEDHDRVAETILESARTLEAFFCEFRVILPQQGLRWRWSQAQPQRMEDGGTLWHGIISDITDLKLAEEERIKLQEQLQQAHKMESVGRLAGGVAHDYNNMLSVILGYTEMAIDRVSPNDLLNGYLMEIFKAAQHSTEITRQLLAFARKQTIAPKVVDLNEVVESMLRILRRLIGEDIDLIWNPGQKLWLVKIDPAQVNQILANLCVNARDAIKGGGKITIETHNVVLDETHRQVHPDFLPGEYVSLIVTDDGCGMDPKTLDNIFEPFFTTKDVNKGTGLGLATIYGIVKQNNGFIEVSSKPGQGSTFTVYLSRHFGEQLQEKPTEEVEIPKGYSETVLLVEDEPAIMRMAQEMLRHLGYDPLTAATPSQAIAMAEKYANVNLLITDVVMPEMNGHELSAKLTHFYPGLKTLFMSGYTADIIGDHGILENGWNFIQKPFSVKELGLKVRAILEV